ncbi:MAG TPA: Rieske 2Fe-2S domain-containing protein [Chloroflexota bacterium]|jgi:5,5'-dehydrodivanillate O-demethylase
MVASTAGVGRALDADRYLDFVHTGPGTLAGRYLRHFWQPVYVAADLPAGYAKPLRIMSEDFTLYRGADGAAHLVAPRCAHRGTQLSTGWVEDDCIRCFYHGWKYDQTGQCVEMPAEDPSFPPKVRIASYPTEEYLGLIFAYLGDAERGDTGAVSLPPLPRYPDFETDGVLSASSYVRPCNYFQNLENGLDNVHVLFVHRDAPGGERYVEQGMPRIVAEESPWGVTERVVRPRGAGQHIQGGMPNVLFIPGQAIGNRAVPVDFLAWRVPLDDEQHLTFNVNIARVTGEAADEYRARRRAPAAADAVVAAELGHAVLRGEQRVHDMVDRPLLVNVQDTVAQLGQGVIADRDHERLGRSDAAVILLRKLWARELRALDAGQPLKEWTRVPPAPVAARPA